MALEKKYGLDALEDLETIHVWPDGIDTRPWKHVQDCFTESFALTSAHALALMGRFVNIWYEGKLIHEITPEGMAEPPRGTRIVFVDDKGDPT